MQLVASYAARVSGFAEAALDRRLVKSGSGGHQRWSSVDLLRAQHLGRWMRWRLLYIRPKLGPV